MDEKPSLKDFKLLKPLGSGKFGTVFTAIHFKTGAIFAIKKIKKEVIKHNMMVEQLINEIKIQGFCQHENVVHLYSCFDEKDYLYLVL